MKFFYSVSFLLITVQSLLSQSDIPSDYYDSANGLIGYPLKTQLKNIISNGHITRDYGQLYDGDGIAGSRGFIDTHSDLNISGGANYDNDGTVLDFYSERPYAIDPYNYTHGNNQCGNQSSEGDCYNREHLVPQSAYDDVADLPMKTDIHHVIPSDGRVNNFRGSYPFGIVAVANWTSLNNSKRGSSGMAGYSGIVFEPIDEFKGDIARALLYFATRYETTVFESNAFDNTNFAMFNGTSDQVFTDWAIELLLEWHNTVDPVDERERERNEAAWDFQGNANPFVSHPEFATKIWDPEALSTTNTIQQEIKLHPNPTKGESLFVEVQLPTVVELFDLTGHSILKTTVNQNHSSIDIRNLSSGIYILYLQNAQAKSTRKLVRL